MRSGSGSPPASPRPARNVESKASSAWTELHRLKLLSVILPIVFVVVMEVGVGRLVESGLLEHRFQLAFEIFVAILAITAFGLVMFRFIDRAQRQVLKQNRDLAATNAVSTAVRGEVGVDRIIDVALESVMLSTGASEVSVTVFPPESSPLDNETHHRRAATGSNTTMPDDPGDDALSVVEIPLSTGTRFVGRMLLHLPSGARVHDGLGSGTLQVIGQQLANAIQLAQLVADLERRNHEGNVFHDVLLQISSQSAPADILESVVQHARDLPGADDAVLCLNEEAARSVRLEGSTTLCGGASFSTPGAGNNTADTVGVEVHESHLGCPNRSASTFGASLTIPLRGPGAILGDLWVARRSGIAFTARDQNYLGALCGLAAIALTSAQARENERQAAILAERERIAREMHDSLAQVLGVTHLRLRALDSHEVVVGNQGIAVELTQLADICEEGYRDVREAILGLRESSRTERGLLEALGAYLVKYTQQCGIETSLESDLDHELALSPRSEVQVIRVIQEALTNVRKHSGAKSAVVRIAESESATTFVVEDDGQGFDMDGSTFDRDGFGLISMRERMGLLNGSLTIDSPPGHGTRVIASVPERSRPKLAPVEVKSAAGQTDPHPARGRSAALSWRDRSPDRRTG